MEATLATYDIVAKHLDRPNYPQLEILKGPVQDNCYDCGLYMIMAIEFIVLNLHNSVLFQNPLPNFTARDCKLKRASLGYLLHYHHIITPDTLEQFITIKSNTPHINGSNKSKLSNDMSSGKIKNKNTSPSVNIAVQANLSRVIEESPKAVTKIKVVGDSHTRSWLCKTDSGKDNIGNGC